MNQIAAVSALLLAGVATPAFAQNYGDLILGFSSGSSATNIEVDLGTAGSYSGLAAGTYNLASLGSDLSSTYGASWNSSALTFGIAGANSVTTTPSIGTFDAAYPKSTVFASEAETSPGTSATPYLESIAGQQGGAITNIAGVLGLSAATEGFALGTSLTDLTGQTTAVGTTLDAISINTSALGAWTAQGGNVALNISKVTSLQQSVSAGGAAVEVFDLAPANNLTSTDINGATPSYFELLGNGSLEFVVVPEPSTYAAIIGAAVLGYALLRRRRTLA